MARKVPRSTGPGHLLLSPIKTSRQPSGLLVRCTSLDVAFEPRELTEGQCCWAFCGVTSLGRTTAYPSPCSINCTASPEPPRSIDPIDCERCSEVARPAVQPTIASVSTYSGYCGETG